MAREKRLPSFLLHMQLRKDKSLKCAASRGDASVSGDNQPIVLFCRLLALLFLCRNDGHVATPSSMWSHSDTLLPAAHLFAFKNPTAEARVVTGLEVPTFGPAVSFELRQAGFLNWQPLTVGFQSYVLLNFRAPPWFKHRETCSEENNSSGVWFIETYTHLVTVNSSFLC